MFLGKRGMRLFLKQFRGYQRYIFYEKGFKFLVFKLLLKVESFGWFNGRLVFQLYYRIEVSIDGGCRNRVRRQICCIFYRGKLGYVCLCIFLVLDLVFFQRQLFRLFSLSRLWKFLDWFLDGSFEDLLEQFQTENIYDRVLGFVCFFYLVSFILGLMGSLEERFIFYFFFRF